MVSAIGNPRHQLPAQGAPQTPSRLMYRHEQYQAAAAAVAGMRAQLVDGWRIVQIRGPAVGPFDVVYLKEVGR